jgi:SAM-dependent methyltransferase
MDSNEIKELVKEKYGEIALKDRTDNAASCCGATGSCEDVANIMAEDYTKLGGYEDDADLALGCGLPTQFAKIKPGDTVIDLGSGAGNDVFIARHETGETGKVIGVDFTPAMIAKARENADKLGFTNVEFRQGDIEDMPVANNRADVVVSNCVLNLVPDKERAISEIHRVLKPGGHFSISDIVLEGELPEGIKSAAEMYAGCVSGSLQKSEYLGFIEKQGFANITVQKEKAIVVPDEILQEYLSQDEINSFKESDTGIYSVTVYAEKKEEQCCEPGGGCC